MTINELLIGQTLDGYRIENMLGKGMVGAVYRATSPNGESVALKLFTPATGDDTLMMNRFALEAKTLSRLEHPNIVPVLEVGVADDLPYIVMPLVEGESLADRLERDFRIGELEVTEIGWQIADALHYANEQGVIHRDVKPSNILLTNDGHALLTDFGVALMKDNPQLTQEGAIVGTPAYLAPEQIQHSRNIDQRTDLYSLGVVLYHAATGTLPFAGSTYEMLHAHVNSVATPPSKLATISPKLEQIIQKSIRKAPSERFQDSHVLAQELLALNRQLRQLEPISRNWQHTITQWAMKLGL